MSLIPRDWERLDYHLGALALSVCVCVLVVVVVVVVVPQS